MEDYGIKQLANPVGDQDAVNLTSMKKYVGKPLRLWRDTGHKKNALAYLNSKGRYVTPVNNVTSVTFQGFASNLHLLNQKSLSLLIL